MRIAGTTCKQCGRGISIATDGVACESCNGTWHKTCVQVDDGCPECKQPFGRWENTTSSRWGTLKLNSPLKNGRVWVG